jgi:DNA-binding transcriptional LysR family regulator
MNLETIKVFCNVVRHQSFSRGAAASNMTQSAATQCVRRIEEELGERLLDRGKRPFMLTRTGGTCYEEFLKLIEIHDALIDRLQAGRNEICGNIHVAAIYSVGLYGLCDCMQEFMRRYPKAKVGLEYLRPAEVYEAVESGRAQIGIVSYPAATPGLVVVPLQFETMVLVCRPDHALATRERVSIKALRGERLVGFDKDLPIRKEIDRCLRQQSVSARVVMEFDNIETIKQAVEVGAGISILPEPTVSKEAEIGTLAVVRFGDCQLRRPIGMVHRERMVFSPTLTRFAELVRQMAVERLAPTG